MPTPDLPALRDRPGWLAGPVGPVQAPVGVVLTLVGAGLAVVATTDWEPGVVVVALALVLAAGLRLALPPTSAGWLAVRGRAFDTSLLLVLGLGLLVLAGSVPEA